MLVLLGTRMERVDITSIESSLKFNIVVRSLNILSFNFRSFIRLSTFRFKFLCLTMKFTFFLNMFVNLFFRSVNFFGKEPWVPTISLIELHQFYEFLFLLSWVLARALLPSPLSKRAMLPLFREPFHVLQFPHTIPRELP